MDASTPPLVTTDEFVARQRTAVQTVIAIPPAVFDADPRRAAILRLVAATHTPREPGEAPVDPVRLVRWVLDMFAGRGIDLDLMARSAEADISVFVGWAISDEVLQ